MFMLTSYEAYLDSYSNGTEIMACYPAGAIRCPLPGYLNDNGTEDRSSWDLATRERWVHHTLIDEDLYPHRM